MKPIRAMEVRRDSCLLLRARGASRGVAPICILLRLGKVCIDRSMDRDETSHNLCIEKSKFQHTHILLRILASDLRCPFSCPLTLAYILLHMVTFRYM